MRVSVTFSLLLISIGPCVCSHRLWRRVPFVGVLQIRHAEQPGHYNCQFVCHQMSVTGSDRRYAAECVGRSDEQRTGFHIAAASLHLLRYETTFVVFCFSGCVVVWPLLPSPFNRRLSITEKPVVTFIWPTTGPVRGSTVVTVLGNHFLRKEELFCKFGTHASAIATYVTYTHVECLSPVAAAPETCAVEMSMNDQDFSTNALQYQYLGAFFFAVLFVCSFVWLVCCCVWAFVYSTQLMELNYFWCSQCDCDQSESDERTRRYAHPLFPIY